MQRYVPKKPLISGTITCFVASIMQLFCIFCIGLVNFSGYENVFVDTALILLSLFTFFMSIKAFHNLFYGIVGRNIKNNQIFLSICPTYKKIHDDLPILNNVKLIYEYPLSAIGFIETLDDLYPAKNKI